MKYAMYYMCIIYLVAQMVKNLPAMLETWAQTLGQEDPLGKEMVTHSRILAWRIPWTEELGGLSSWGHKQLDVTEHLTLATACSLKQVGGKKRFMLKCIIYGVYIHIYIMYLNVNSVTHLTLYDSMDYSLPGSSVHGILQARTLEWVAIPFSRGSSRPRD